MPLVSVIIPAYNHADKVERSIESVLGQSYAPIELIVVDDGSKDATWDVIRRVHARHDGSFEIHTQQNRGVSTTLNFAIARSRGPLIALVASDDYFLPDKIERQVEFLLRNGPEVGLVHCGALEDRGDGAPIEIRGQFVPAEGACFRQLLAREVTAIAPSIMFRREVYDRVGGFDETLVGEDRDFFVAVAAAGYKFGYDPTPMLVKSTGKANLSSRVELFFQDPFKTLAKYRDRISPQEYARIENGFFRGMGRAAAGVGKLGLSWFAYQTLARRTGDLRPYAEFVARTTRYLALAAMPASARYRLRAARARRHDQQSADSARA